MQSRLKVRSMVGWVTVLSVDILGNDIVPNNDAEYRLKPEDIVTYDYIRVPNRSYSEDKTRKIAGNNPVVKETWNPDTQKIIKVELI